MEQLMSLMPLILLIVIMYFLLIRPQKKRDKQVNAMRAGIKTGDEIVTIGGIYGTVVKTKDDQLVIQVGADKTKLEIARWAVSKLVNEEPAPARNRKPTPEKEEPPKKARPKKLEKTETPVPTEMADGEKPAEEFVNMTETAAENPAKEN